MALSANDKPLQFCFLCLVSQTLEGSLTFTLSLAAAVCCAQGGPNATTQLSSVEGRHTLMFFQTARCLNSQLRVSPSPHLCRCRVKASPEAGQGFWSSWFPVAGDRDCPSVFPKQKRVGVYRQLRFFSQLWSSFDGRVADLLRELQRGAVDLSISMQVLGFNGSGGIDKQIQMQ